MSERVDAVVVGARCAGSATAIALARAGPAGRRARPRRVPGRHDLDAPAVPRRGRRARAARGARAGRARSARRRCREALVGGRGRRAARAVPRRSTASTTAGACGARGSTRRWWRPRARPAPTCARGVRSTDLVWDDGRVAGVRWTDADGSERRAARAAGRRRRRAALDGRAARRAPTRAVPLQRQRPRLLLRLLRATTSAEWRGDRRPVARGRASWRPRSRATTACCSCCSCRRSSASPDVPRRPARASSTARSRAMPGLRERLRGAASVATKVRSATDTTSYFRRSSGPGLGAARRRRPLQGPGHRAGHPRRAALRAPARRGGRAGPRRPAALDARAAGVGAPARARVPGDLPVDERARPRRGDDAARGRAVPRAGPRSRALTPRLLDVFSRMRAPSRALGAGPARLALQGGAARRGDATAPPRCARWPARRGRPRRTARARAGAARPLPPLAGPAARGGATDRTSHAPARRARSRPPADGGRRPALTRRAITRAVPAGAERECFRGARDRSRPRHVGRVRRLELLRAAARPQPPAGGGPARRPGGGAGRGGRARGRWSPTPFPRRTACCSACSPVSGTSPASHLLPRRVPRAGVDRGGDRRDRDDAARRLRPCERRVARAQRGRRDRARHRRRRRSRRRRAIPS